MDCHCAQLWTSLFACPAAFVLANDFFEFLPDNSEPLLLSQVSPGMTCEVIVTNRAGLYRYRTGIRISLVEHLPQGNAIIRIVE